MNKIIFYLTVFAIAVCIKTTAQQNCSFDNRYNGLNNFGLVPVYYNYSSRQLFYNGIMPLNGNAFLGMCRGINDFKVQQQIARYDQLTKNKKRLVALTIVSGIGGYLLSIGSLAGFSSYRSSDSQNATLAVGALALLACPVLAISTAIPHQKRKEVVFRDLPAAYNFYVESQTKK
ncbi:MAG TPA: hypothetical protein VN026_12515 [Bacteroidia bacterium]|jgi:hypothetical protein|nr:hypothetical protein [Bacteroidia bacterium]